MTSAGMPRRALFVACVLSLASTVASLVACKEKPVYDDAPITAPVRKKKSPEPPEFFDIETLCAQLIDLPGAGIGPEQKSDLREACRHNLADVKKSHPDEFACRCRCIGGAGDLLAVERCTRYCDAEDPERVCDHVVGVENDTNDAGTLEGAHDDCVKALKKLHADDPARWTCTVRCLVGATAKPDALACNVKCGAASTSDAGIDGAPPASPTTGIVPKPAPFPTEIE
jgi:hypothetical protein